MNVIDSSGWLEYFTDGPRKDVFKARILASQELVVPVLTIYEVFKKFMQERGLKEALRVTGVMERSRVIDMDADLAKDAAYISVRHHLTMADATILATARAAGATLWTMDADFEGLPGVEYVPRRD